MSSSPKNTFTLEPGATALDFKQPATDGVGFEHACCHSTPDLWVWVWCSWR